MKINFRNWSGIQIIVLSGGVLLCAFGVGAVAKAAEAPDLGVYFIICLLVAWFLLTGWSWMQPQLKEWSGVKLMVPGACILIFAALGQWFFTRKFGLAFVLFFGVPYGILIFSWYRLVDRIEK